MTWENSMQPICGWKLRLMAAWQNTTQLRTLSHTWTVSLPRQEPLQVAFWFPGSFRQSSRSSAAIHAPRSCLSPASPLGKKLSTQGQVRERSGYFFLPRSSAARLTSTVSRLLGFLQGPHDQTIRQIQEGQDSETFKLNRILNFFFLSAAQFGNFTFTMDMYETDQYLKPYDSYPVKKNLQEKMYLEVKVTSNDSKLVLIPERCWATPSDDPNDGKFFAFIEKG